MSSLLITPSSRILLNFCKSLNRRYTAVMTKKALVVVAPGTEEMEAVISIDVLRRGGIEVTVAGLPDGNTVTCSRGVNLKPDISIKDASSKGPFDAIVLPGGFEGAKALAASKEVGDLIREQEKAGRITAAICAAPTALKAHKVYNGKSLTSYPGLEKEVVEGTTFIYKQDPVVEDGTLITSRGPGTAFVFALTVVEHINGKAKACEVGKAMLVSY